MKRFREVFRSESGFTLIELLVVIAVLSILATIAVPRLGGLKDKAKKTEAINALGAVKTALEMYYVEKDDKYPGSQDDFNTMAGEYIDGYDAGSWEDWSVTYTVDSTTAGGPEFNVKMSKTSGTTTLIATLKHTAKNGYSIE